MIDKEEKTFEERFDEIFSPEWGNSKSLSDFKTFFRKEITTLLDSLEMEGREHIQSECEMLDCVYCEEGDDWNSAVKQQNSRIEEAKKQYDV